MLLIAVSVRGELARQYVDVHGRSASPAHRLIRPPHSVKSILPAKAQTISEAKHDTRQYKADSNVKSTAATPRQATKPPTSKFLWTQVYFTHVNWFWKQINSASAIQFVT